jgi:dolichyl-phosphate beta-glucosyltransferase
MEVEERSTNMHDLPSEQPLYSFVIPAFNEAPRLPSGLNQLRSFVDQQGLTCEVVVVNDGSTDDTAAVVRRWIREWPVVRLVDGPHRGKGGAVRAGIMAATGWYIALADADFAMPAAAFSLFTPELERFPVVIGSRERPGAHRFNEPTYRHVMGRVFNRLTQFALLPGIQDTQCGFKVLRGDIAQALCRQQTIDGWGFDVELLVIAHLRGHDIIEVPIPWTYISGSRVNPIRDTLTMVRDLARIWLNRQRGLYTVEAPAHEASTPLLSSARYEKGG